MNRRVCRVGLLTLAAAVLTAVAAEESSSALLHSLEQRQQHDSRLLQDALRLALDNNSEFSGLKEQLTTLKWVHSRLPLRSAWCLWYMTLAWLINALSIPFQHLTTETGSKYCSSNNCIGMYNNCYTLHNFVFKLGYWGFIIGIQVIKVQQVINIYFIFKYNMGACRPDKLLYSMGPCRFTILGVYLWFYLNVW